MESADVAVIGGGIAGGSVAYELAEHCEVVLLEREPFCGYHTTGRSAAVFTEVWERGLPGLLTSGSRRFFENPPADFSDAAILSPLPVLMVGRADQRTTFEAVVASAAGRVEVEVFEGPDVVEACPVLAPEVVALAVLEPTSREIDVAALHQGYLRGARRRGARVLTNAAVVAIERDGGRWTIESAAGAVSADVVVNASGAWGDELAVMAGIDAIGLQPMRRTAFTFEAPGDITGWPMVVEIEEQFYFKPERSQIMGSLAEESPMEPHDVRAEEVDVARAIDRIQAATTLEIRHVKRTWAGLRTFAADRDPVNGFDPAAAGFFWLVGQGGYGIMTSPAMARAAAGLIVDDAIPGDLAALGITAAAMSPERFR